MINQQEEKRKGDWGGDMAITKGGDNFKTSFNQKKGVGGGSGRSRRGACFPVGELLICEMVRPLGWVGMLQKKRAP